jgi:purine-binding chemotaxis protein CheW
MNDAVKYICFGLGQEDFGIPLLTVKEVLAIPDITPVPQTPPYFLGIINLRGSVISIMDLRVKFGIKSVATEETTVIILDFGDYQLGVVVDRVDSVVSLIASQISNKPHIESSKSTDYISGVYRQDQKLVLILDIAKALSVEDKKIAARPTEAKAA